MQIQIEKSGNSIQSITWNGLIPIREEMPIPIAKLTIPQISLEEPLFAKDSKENNLDKHIIFLKESAMPDEENQIVLIAGHSGIGKNAYFKSLDQLAIGEEVKLTYQNQDYLYTIMNRIIENKIGAIHFFTRPDKSYLVLTTCMPNEKGKQLTLVAEKKSL